MTIAVATILLLYAVSLSILGLAEEIGNGSTAARFHGGHAAVSAVWGLLGLVALYVGLRKGLGWLQAVGFGLFAVSLAKIFLYDLTFLSSITRALSFLAVGAVLLLGGFFVQRLGTQQRGGPRPDLGASTRTRNRFDRSFRRTHGQSPRVLRSASQATPKP